jgi:glycosyltransferase involved in cell wall biosynthesis
MKTVLVMPVKNEDWILEKTLACADLWADHIIIADQKSTDRTREIINKFPKAKLIENEATFHSSTVRKLLLDEARKIEGQNLILSFDADEIPTADIIQDIELIKSKLKPGCALELQWLNLWRSPLQYRDDRSLWSNSWKVFGFVDDGAMNYDQVDSLNDHTSRVPFAAHQNIVRLEMPKVLHYQFADWERTMSKQCRYRLTEFMFDHRLLNVIRINHRYFHTKNEKHIAYGKVKQEWLGAYESSGADLADIGGSGKVSWFDLEVLSAFKEKGSGYFRWLDIWDVDWEAKRRAAPPGWRDSVPSEPIVDPRNIFIRLYHSTFQSLLDYDSPFYKLFSYLKKI